MKENMNEIELLEKLFPFIIPKYNEAHDIMTAMLDHEQSKEIRLADLGCGFGDLTQKVADHFPFSVIFGVDKQKQILERAKNRLAEPDQFVPFQRDLAKSTWLEQIDQLHAVVSSFTLDYLTVERHQQIITEAIDLLLPGGRWISCEFFRSQDQRINHVFHDLEMSFIQNALKNGDVTTEQIDLLSQSTILRQDHHVCTVEDKVEWLQKAGFTNIDIPWRFLNIAILSGVKK